MIDKKQNRLRRARATRARIKDMKVNRLTVHRTNLHIYAQIISADGKNVLCAASTLEPEGRQFVLSSPVRQERAATSTLQNLSVHALLKKQRLPELSLAHSTVPDIVFMAVLPRLPTQRAKPVSSSKE